LSQIIIEHDYKLEYKIQGAQVIVNKTKLI